MKSSDGEQEDLCDGACFGPSAGLLTLLLDLTFQPRGMLSGTLFGRVHPRRVEGFHYAIVAIGLGLAALSTFNSLIGSILERRRESAY